MQQATHSVWSNPGSGQVTSLEIEVGNDLYLHKKAMGYDWLWSKGRLEARSGDLSWSQPVLRSIAAFAKTHQLGMIVSDGADIGASELSHRIRHRLRDHSGRDDVVEIRPRLDRVGEVEPPGVPEAEVGQVPVLSAFRGNVEFDEVHDMPHRRHDVFGDRLPPALEVTAENRAPDGRPGRAVTTLIMKLDDREELGDERVDAVSGGLAVGEERVPYGGVEPHFENDLEVVRAGEHWQVRQVKRLLVAEQQHAVDTRRVALAVRATVGVMVTHPCPLS